MPTPKKTPTRKPPQSKSPAPAAKAPAKTAPAAHAIDPSQAAAAAAAMVAHKVPNPAAAQGHKSESTSFKNLKQSLAKPHSQTIGGVLDKLTPAGQKRSALPFESSRQVGHNQTFGADVNRRNVPRRTNG